MKTIIIDLDNTLTLSCTNDYQFKKPNLQVVAMCRKYKQLGFEIVVFTSRNMNKYKGDLNLIQLHTFPLIIEWLEHYKVPYDKLIVGKPWCGFNGFYVDDRAIRPDEFVKLSYNEISKMLDINK